MALISIHIDPPMSADRPGAVLYTCDGPGCTESRYFPAGLLMDCAQPIYCAEHQPITESCEPWGLKMGKGW